MVYLRGLDQFEVWSLKHETPKNLGSLALLLFCQSSSQSHKNVGTLALILPLFITKDSIIWSSIVHHLSHLWHSWRGHQQGGSVRKRSVPEEESEEVVGGKGRLNNFKEHKQKPNRDCQTKKAGAHSHWIPSSSSVNCILDSFISLTIFTEFSC